MPANSRNLRLISVAEAADRLGVSTRSIRRYISDGRLPGYRVGPRALRVNEDDLGALLRPLATGGASA